LNTLLRLLQLKILQLKFIHYLKDTKCSCNAPDPDNSYLPDLNHHRSVVRKTSKHW